MNVFMLLIVFMFMAGWYFMGSPGQNIQEHGIEYAERRTELNSLLTCIVHVHAQAIELDNQLKINERVEIDNSTPCAEKYGLATVKICVDGTRASAACIPDRANRSIQNFVITSAAAAPVGDRAGKALELLANEFSTGTNFGLLVAEGREFVIISGNGEKRSIPAIVVREAGLSAGQFVYMTQYAVAGRPAFASGQVAELVRCPPGQIQIFRFNRWQCAPVGNVRLCLGATIWDDTLQDCVPDNSRRPLCGPRQTAVMIDYNWECMDPLLQKTCPPGQSPHLDYATMEWRCSLNPAESADAKRCEAALRIRAGSGGTIRVGVASSCNDCEEMITNPETCETACVPSLAKLGSDMCYRGTCSGPNRAFYFGFPNPSYLVAARAALPELLAIEVRMSAMHSLNRRFNCLDCGDRGLDMENSFPPWTAVCR